MEMEDEGRSGEESESESESESGLCVTLTTQVVSSDACAIDVDNNIAMKIGKVRKPFINDVFCFSQNYFIIFDIA